MNEEMNEVARYHNDFFKLNLSSMREIEKGKYIRKPYSATEIKLLLAIVNKVYDEGCKKVSIPLGEIEYLTQTRAKDEKRFLQSLFQMQDDLADLKMREVTESHRAVENVFQKIEVSKNGTVTVIVNENYKYLFNNLLGNYSKIYLALVSQMEKYDMRIAMRLLEWHEKGHWIVSVDELREWLSVPNNYDFHKLKQKILDPSVERLKNHFPHLKYSMNKSNNRVVSLDFSFLNDAESVLNRMLGSDGGMKRKRKSLSFEEVESAEPFEKVYNAEWDGPFGTFSDGSDVPF